MAETAAFYDLDGTLIRGNIASHWAWFARHEPSLLHTGGRLARLALSAPRLLRLDRLDRRLGNEAFYRQFRGMSADRLDIAGEDLVAHLLTSSLYDGVHELLASDRQAGHRLVLVTGSLDVVAEPLARALGFDDVASNRLILDRRGLATGELRPPVYAGPGKAEFVHRYAAEHALDLARCRAYSDDHADLPLLCAVGRPIAVNPNSRLRATAAAHGWPILTLHAREARVVDRVIDASLSALRALERPHE